MFKNFVFALLSAKWSNRILTLLRRRLHSLRAGHLWERQFGAGSSLCEAACIVWTMMNSLSSLGCAPIFAAVGTLLIRVENATSSTRLSTLRNFLDDYELELQKVQLASRSRCLARPTLGSICLDKCNEALRSMVVNQRVVGTAHSC